MTDLELRGISALFAKLLDEAATKTKRDSLAELDRRIAEVIASLPAGPQGIQGPQGERGEAGIPGIQGERGPAGERGERGVQGEAGEPGLPGERGVAGKDGASGSAGERGANGKDGRDGRDGKDGRDGLDALTINPITAVDFDRVYPLGQWASFNGGLFRYDGLAWVNMVDGLSSIEEIREGRTLRTIRHYASGKTEESVFVTSEIQYRDIFKEGDEYQRGDVVTWGGSGWHCNVEKTLQKPGTGSDWRLFVKRGADADKKKDPQPDNIPVRIR